MTERTNTDKKPRGRRPAASIAERIAKAEKELVALREMQRREERENLEKNRKAILDLFKAERLDIVAIEDWKRVVPQLRALVGAETANDSPAAASVTARVEKAGAKAE
jgi:hypothetical protein